MTTIDQSDPVENLHPARQLQRIVMAEPNPIRMLSVEDHPVFREGLSRILSSQPDMLLVAQAGNAEEAVTEFRRHRPDITLMDLRSPGTNGTDALIAIRGEFSPRPHHHAEHKQQSVRFSLGSLD